MRITNKVLSKGYLTDLNRNLQNMKTLQEQLSSGKQIRRPSDNPFKVARSMELNTSLRANERYKENIDEAIGWLETTDSALGQFGDALTRLKELTIQASNSPLGPTELNAVKMEVEQLKDQLKEIGNTSYDGRYIFSGDKTTEIPFEKDGLGNITYNGSVTGLKKEFAPGIVLDIAITGSRLSNSSTGNVFQDIDNIISSLATNQSPADWLDEVNNHIDNVLMLRGEAGARCNRLETMKEKNTEENFNVTELLTLTEDIDFAQKTMEYSVLESVYTASLQTGAKILQPSLLDFLR